jgi:bacterial/archaeal transporter family-2 protein
MNNLFLILFALTAGALVPLQLTFNGQLGGITKNAFNASLIVFLVGTIALSAILIVTRPQWPTLAELSAAPKTIWLGGLIATFYILAVVVITPRLGVGLTVSLVLVGQLCTGLLLDHLGAFGNPQHSFSLSRAAGLAMMVTGVFLIRSAR